VVPSFAADDLAERNFWLPGIRGGVTLPALTGVTFHFIDYARPGRVTSGLSALNRW
jgi:hypothetical protein